MIMKQFTDAKFSQHSTMLPEFIEFLCYNSLFEDLETLEERM